MRRIVMTALLLAGCQAAEGPPPGGDDPCGARQYRSLVGAPVAAVTLPTGLDLRIVGPDDAVTMDYVETRLNLRTDAEGVILAVTCG